MVQLGKTPIRAYDLLTVEFPKDYCYIEDNILTKEGTLLLGGEAKTFKSFIMLEVARALSTGTPFMDDPRFTVPKPVRVLYVEQEVGWRANQQRIENVFAENDPDVWADNFHITSKNLDLHLDNQIGLSNIKATLRDVKPNVVIMDPISYLFHGEENSSTDVGNLNYLIAKIKEVFIEQELSVVLSHHFKKPPEGKYQREGYDPLSENNYRGSSKWKDMGDTLITTMKWQQYEEGKWKCKNHFQTRHGNPPGDVYTTFNANDDFRIRILKDVPFNSHRKNAAVPDKPEVAEKQLELVSNTH